MSSLFVYVIVMYVSTRHRKNLCLYCPYAKLSTGVVVKQSAEESRECELLPAGDICVNGDIECFADKHGLDATCTVTFP
jgi:hypothetical protein